MFKIVKFIILLFITSSLASQTINGVVYSLDDKGGRKTLPGVNVYYPDRSEGTTTDRDGKFSLKINEKKQDQLVFSYVGFKADTVLITNPNEPIEIILSLGKQLTEFVIRDRGAGAHILRMEPLLVQTITTGELQRAACCNLAESFVTNASVDVQYSDAVSGAKQIQLLGLSGIYTQMLVENMPYMRGIGVPFGLEYMPGSWMESIYISKGNASVTNGYESMTGQINIEMKKPEAKEQTFINLYGDHHLRHEVNINQKININKNVQTLLFGHYKNTSEHNTPDFNNDSFLDEPLVQLISFANHWNYNSPDGGFETRFGIRGLSENRRGGQVESLHCDERWLHYGTQIKTQRADAFAKTGYVFGNKSNTSVGFINSVSYHDMESYFGLKTYDASQLGYYSNLIFSTNIKKPEHNLQAGLSFMLDDYDEKLNDSTFSELELVPGAFAQYTYSKHHGITFIAGLRADHHSLFGTFFTPRVMIRYPFNEHLTLRASAGKGYRSPRIIAENFHILASSRSIVFEEQRKMEEAFNMGANISWSYKLFGKDFTATAEYYRTSFVNQMIVDYEKDMNSIRIYNLDGESFAQHAQIEISYLPIKGLDVKAAVRFNDVKSTYNGDLRDKYLVNRWKYFLTGSYLTDNKKWQFDLTGLVNGRSRLPDLSFNPIEYQLDDYSPMHFIMHSQISYFMDKWSFYIGSENLLDYKQRNPILAADDPFGPYFDSSLVWGPVIGRKIYAGIRFKIDKK